MTEDIKTAKADARALRAKDAALAMREYQLEKLAVLARTERLRAMRLSQKGQASNEIRQQGAAKMKKAAKAETVKEGNG